METVREQINAIRNDVLNRVSQLTPDEIFEYSAKLSVLIGNLGDAMAEAEQEYIKVLEAALSDPNMKVNRATILAKRSNEYKEFVKIKALYLSVQELIRSLKRRRVVLEDDQFEHSKKQV